MNKILKRLKPARVSRVRGHKKTFLKFADKIGFVYFGFVDQREDEHKLVRGMSLSLSHTDNHYTIGTFHGYDMTLVERSDIIKQPDTLPVEKNWVIATVDLRTKLDLPHIYISHANEPAPFNRYVMTKFPYLQKLYPGSVAPFAPEFLTHYALYAAPTYGIYVEQLLGGEIQKQLFHHFGDLSFEVMGSVLYVYSENKQLSDALLSHMVQCGVWLATEIDRHSQN